MGGSQAFAVWVVIIVGLVIYVGSLYLHPFRRCPRCKGSGEHRGALFTYSHRRCRRCGGNGRQPRLGTWVFGPRVGG